MYIIGEVALVLPGYHKIYTPQIPIVNRLVSLHIPLRITTTT